MRSRALFFVVLWLLGVQLGSGKNLYKMLGVKRDSTVREIKKAYRKLALTLHPDKLGDAATEADKAKFLDLTEAYGILSDEESRAIYDENGYEAMKGGGRGGGARGAGGGQAHTRSYQHRPFGMRVRTPVAAFELEFKPKGLPKEQATVVDVLVSLEEVAAGVNKTVNVSVARPCPHCHGTGAASPQHVHSCSACSGTGRLFKMEEREGGYRHMIRTDCHVCEGTGRIAAEACPVCGGRRFVAQSISKEVAIDAGLPPGTAVAMNGQGGHALHMKPGDLLFRIQYEPHPRFQVEYPNLVLVKHLSLLDAILGFQDTVRDVYNNSVTIANTGMAFSGHRQRHHGHGLIDRTARVPAGQIPPKGDLIVEFRVDFPRVLSPQQRLALQEVMDEDELALLEDVLRMASAHRAEEAGRESSAEELRRTRHCAAGDPFFTPWSQRLEWELLWREAASGGSGGDEDEA